LAASALSAEWVAERLPPRSTDAHKGTFGRLLIVAGSLEYGGAALLAGLGAARAGAGLVSVASPASVAHRLIGLVPELTLLPLDEEAAGFISPGGWRRLAAASHDYDALVVGPGLGRQRGTLRRAAALVAGAPRPAVVDADGLNALAEADGWWRKVTSPLVLTPHPGEFARLVPGVRPTDDESRERAALDAARAWAQVVVLKGARTVIARPDGSVLRSPVSTPALATAGSGDVLAGAIGALLAAGAEPFVAAACGVAVHAEAGRLAEERIGRSGTMARDVAGLLPEAAERLRRGASP
jgi:NAD(P)H-hydrate epimerase